MSNTPFIDIVLLLSPVIYFPVDIIFNLNVLNKSNALFSSKKNNDVIFSQSKYNN